MKPSQLNKDLYAVRLCGLNTATALLPLTDRPEVKRWLVDYIRSQEQFKIRDEKRFGLKESDFAGQELTVELIKLDHRVELLLETWIAHKTKAKIAASINN